MSASNSVSTPEGAQRQLHDGLKHVLAMFASGVKALHGDKLLAGDELAPKNIDGFIGAMGIPADEADKNVLLTFAKVTGGTTPGESDDARAAYARYPGGVAENLAACQELRELCESGILTSLSSTQRKILMRCQGRVVKRLCRHLHKDPAALRLVQTLAGLGFFATAAWLQWTADERAWKIGSWPVVCIGAIRLLGNLMYNDAGTIHQGWKTIYVHLGLGSVAYALELLRRFKVKFEANNTTMIVSLLANLIPVLGFYMRNIESGVEEGIYRAERRRKGAASAADATLLQPILNRLMTFTTISENTLAAHSPDRPGNRTAATAKEAEIETRNLADLLALSVDPISGSWREFFKLLLQEATKKSPSLIYALATGVILVAAAVGNTKALADSAIVLNMILIEIGLGIKNPKLTAEQMQYRLLLLILSRFGSVFFFAAGMIHDYRKTGRRDVYDREPGFAAVMAHCNAAFVCVLGLQVIPTIGLFDRVLKAALNRAFQCCTAGFRAPYASAEAPDTSYSGDELDEIGHVEAGMSQSPMAARDIHALTFANMFAEAGSQDEEDEDYSPSPGLIWTSDSEVEEDDPEADKKLDEIANLYVRPAVEEFAKKIDGNGELPASMMVQIVELAGLTGSSEIDCSF